MSYMESAERKIKHQNREKAWREANRRWGKGSVAYIERGYCVVASGPKLKRLGVGVNWSFAFQDAEMRAR